MISFLNPAALWLLPAAAAPILIHLIFMKRARRVRFSDLTLLRAAYLKALPSSRLKQWLLLAVRCLLLLCLVLAFARPIFSTSPTAAAGDDAISVVLLLDGSYSMRYRINGRTRFENAQAVAHSILGSLGASDRIATATFSDKIENELKWAADKSEASAAINRAALTYGGTNFPAVLESGYSFLRRSNARGRKIIVLLSDGAAHGWSEHEPVERAVPSFDPSVLLLGLQWPEDGENGAVMAVELQPQEDKAKLRADAALFGGARPAWPLELWLKDRRVDQKHLDLQPGSIQTDFSLGASAQGSQWGRVELRADGLADDDMHYFSYWTQERAKVLLVHGGPRSLDAGRAGYFFKKLFADAQGSLLPYQLDILDSVRFQSVPLTDYQAMILVDFKTFSPELTAQLERFARKGGGLWIIPSRFESSQSFKALAPVLPAVWGVESARSASGLVQRDREEDQSVSWADFDIANVTVKRIYNLERTPAAKVWFEDGSGRPLVVGGVVGQGRVVVWAMGLDLEWTNLALKPVFAPLADLTLRRLTGFAQRRQWRTILAGEKIKRSWTLQEAAPSVVRLKTPAGREINLRVEGRAVEHAAEVPGLYLMEFPGSRSEPEVFAVNLDRSKGESNLGVLASPPWQALRVGDGLKEDLTRALFGREARSGALALMLLLLAIESFIRRTPRLKKE